MFLMKKSYLGVGMAMGMMAGAAATMAAVLCMPQGRCMARRVMKQGKRMVRQHIAPMMNR